MPIRRNPHTLRPHADLLWEQGAYALGVTLAKVKFPNGQIDSTQWGLALDVATDFNYVPAGRLDGSLFARGRAGAGFTRLQVVASVYRLRSGLLLIDGAVAPRSLRTIGVRTEQEWGHNTYWGLEASGAVQAGVAGYAEYLANLGVEGEAIQNHLNVGARVALGMAGGGGVPVGGGFAAKAAVYNVIRLSDDMSVSIEAGVASTPQGRFRAASLSAAMMWALEGHDGSEPTRPVRTDFSAGAERYSAVRRDGGSRVINANVLEIDRFLSPNFYVSGQVHSAISGGAGGYSAALIGAGWMQSLSSRWYAGGELLVGAAGGGGVDSHGSIFQPMVYAGVKVTPTLTLRIGGGRVQALQGPLGATVIDLSLTATYGASGGK